MSLQPRRADSAEILLFRLDEGRMTLTHRTPVEQPPTALVALGGRLLAGVGPALRLYDIGKRQLLRKCEARLPNAATVIQTMGWRVFVGDGRASVLVYQYQNTDNKFLLIADDTHTRPVTVLLPLDYDTVAMGDRVGCLSILRLPAALAEGLDNESFIGTVTAKREHLFAAPYKLERLGEFYLGDTITSLNKSALTLGARELLLYTTISGSLGVFMPFFSRDEALLFQTLEAAMRRELPATLAGRDHLRYRSYYAPVKSIIDGDLCETFATLSGERQHLLSQGLANTPAEIIRKLHDQRTNAGI